ncbi:hypothetical protein [Nocardia abscessus]|nr:hypothetical protein [Nocardia abscessus]
MHTNARHESLVSENTVIQAHPSETVAGFDNLYGSRQRENRSVGIPFEYPAIAPDTSTRAAHFAIATIDQRGRLSDRSAIRRLDWESGRTLSLAVHEQAAVIRRADEGTSRISPAGYLHLPAAIRHACGIQRADQLLLVASLTPRTLVIYPTWVVAMALSSQQTDMWGLA